MARETSLSGKEVYFNENELIVSKTDLKGTLTYVNDVFCSIAGYTEIECLGQPHSMIRNANMPRSIFDLLWKTIQGGNEIFAYVVNRCKNGDHYWVLAHVTPSYSSRGSVNGYHSSRRVPDRNILNNTVIPLYKSLLAEEKKHANRKDGMQAANRLISDILSRENVKYDEYVARLAA
ncbi:MAG: PAS domain S-box protein [Cohaesibacteraceae bacterium]|nr:PAS domain S-box protein [Cohaesibacteraceae bacterium]